MYQKDVSFCLDLGIYGMPCQLLISYSRIFPFKAIITFILLIFIFYFGSFTFYFMLIP